VFQRGTQNVRIDHLAYRKPHAALDRSQRVGHARRHRRRHCNRGRERRCSGFSTPRLAALAEQASVEAVAAALDPGTTTVGYQVQLSHTAPTLVGSEVRADAVLESIEGRRLTFRISARDSRGLVGAGRIVRVVVVRDRFMEKARSES
jgi:predicted thioesterase